ncbi:uncharacterized protein LOC130804564 [Amaranthus tricolor]|uniref:uncharacterized protein LOC130804564 n=1 Tax=Amaranthus tricolor TaxID=29722 RepID=UPI00258E37DC|nr:uncharacterized protein LOC130804564 [Amaranthus tricolor]
MGETTCVMNPFSYSTTSHFPNEENTIMYELGESISFGRFVCEDLEWEKWSSFNSSNSNRNRYVAEAEKYSKPGSVAQKKAYFEAHFKRMAALKAAALLEQANNSAPFGSSDSTQILNLSSSLNVQIPAAHYQHSDEIVKKGDNSVTGRFVVHQNELYLNVSDDEFDRNVNNQKEMASIPPPLPPPPPHDHSKKENASILQPLPPPPPHDHKKKEKASLPPPLPPPPPLEHIMKDLVPPPPPPPPLEHIKKDLVPPPPPPPPLDHIKKDVEPSLPPPPSPPVLPHDHHKKEVDATMPSPPPPRKQNLSQKIEIIKNQNVCARKEESSEIKPLLQEKKFVKEEASAEIAAVKKNPPLSSYISSTIIDGRGKDNASLFAPSPARSSTSNTNIHPGKENFATPIKSKSPINYDSHKKKTPLRMSINREFNRILSPVIKKLGSSSKTSTPSKSPSKGSMNNIPQHQPMTPDLSKRGAPTSPSTSRSKISSPIIPNSFCLTGDRTARRKQKLEEKFNAVTATEKAPQSSKFKEKAEAELSKFRQSFCFKAISSPDYYGDNGTFRSPKHKNKSKHGKSPNGGRQHPNTKSTSENKGALPPRRPSVNQFGLKSKRTTLTPS